MNSNRPLVLLVMMAILASLFQVPGGSGTSQNSAGKGPTAITPKAEKGEAEKPSEEEVEDDPWKGPADVVRAFFGDSAARDGARSGQDEVAGLAARAKGYSLESMVVLLPDPAESGLASDFDEALVAVQEVYADAGYLLDRFWLPWDGKSKESHEGQKVPGLLLFRHFEESEGRLAAVLVVGEIPRQGVHPTAFLEALRLVEGWQAGSEQSEDAGPLSEIRIAGPYFSDSMASLRRSLTGFLETRSHLNVRLISGSAMAHRLTKVFQQDQKVQFGQTIVTEEELQDRAVRFFQDKLGWDVTRVALLTQAETAFGQPFLTKNNREHFILVRFPSGISGIRTAWANDVKPPSSGGKGPEMLEVPATSLDLTLGDRDRPLHLLPETGTFTSASRDLAISNLLAVIGERRINFIGILATDPRDTLFLAERIRRLAPSKVLFIVNNHLLFTHPKSAPLMNGTLVLSGYPLFTEDHRWRRELAGPHGKYLRQVTSSFHQGIYRAVASLRTPDELPMGKEQLAWISVIGNSSLWPIARLSMTSSPLRKEEIEAINEGLSHKTGTKLIWFALSLCLLAQMLIALGEVPSCARGQAVIPRIVGPCVLWIAGGTLAVLSTLPYRHLGVHFLWGRDWKLLIAGGLLVVLFCLLARFVAGAWKGSSFVVWFLAILVVSGVLFPVLDQTIENFWMPGGTEHFYRRVFILSSGLSPLVSLAWLGGSLYLWALAELRRFRMMLRQRLGWPLPIGSPARPGDVADAVSLSQAVTGSFPWSRKLWWVILVPAIPAAVLFKLPLRPIAESDAYGRVFSIFLGLTLFLGALSFCRFLWTWVTLHRLLTRLGQPHPPRGLDRDLAKVVAWKPMKSFGWQIPPFGTSTVQAVHCLEELAESGMLWNTGIQVKEISKELESAMDAAQVNDLELEVTHRDMVSSRLRDANTTLMERQTDPVTQRFYALRLISYIRYMFAHLRAFLIAALACGFPLLAAASTYAYEPNEYVTNSIWSLLLLAVLIILVVFYQMDRNDVLCTIADTQPGQVTLSRDLVLGTITYGVVPLLGLVLAQFPNVGRYFVTLLNPLVRALGGG